MNIELVKIRLYWWFHPFSQPFEMIHEVLSASSGVVFYALKNSLVTTLKCWYFHTESLPIASSPSLSLYLNQWQKCYQCQISWLLLRPIVVDKPLPTISMTQTGQQRHDSRVVVKNAKSLYIHLCFFISLGSFNINVIKLSYVWQQLRFGLCFSTN